MTWRKQDKREAGEQLQHQVGRDTGKHVLHMSFRMLLIDPSLPLTARRKKRRREAEDELQYRLPKDLPLEDIAKEMQDSWQLKVPFSSSDLTFEMCRRIFL